MICTRHLKLTAEPLLRRNSTLPQLSAWKKGHTPKATCQNVGAHKYIHTSDWTKRSRWIEISEKQRKMLKYDLEAVPLVFQNCMCRFKYTFAPKKLKPEEPLYKHYIRECFYYKPWSLIYYLFIILFLLTYLEIVLSKVWRRSDVGKYAGVRHDSYSKAILGTIGHKTRCMYISEFLRF